MRDYLLRWEGQSAHISTADVPTPVIYEMIELMEREPDQIDWEGENPAAVLERLRLELQIRAWGLS